MMIILFPKTHNPYFPFLCSSLEVYSYLYFLSCKVYFQIHVQMFVVSLLALPISCLCLMPLTGSFSGIPWPLHLRPHHKGQLRVSRNGRWQDLPATSLKEVRDPQGVVPSMLVRKKKCFAHELTCCASAITLLLSASGKCFPYRFEPESKKSTQLIFARNFRFSISTSLASQILIYSFTFENGATRNSLFFDWNLIRETGKLKLLEIREAVTRRPRLKGGKRNRHQNKIGTLQ